MDAFFKKFDQILDGASKVTIVLDDPAGNSYIQVFVINSWKILC